MKGRSWIALLTALLLLACSSETPRPEPEAPADAVPAPTPSGLRVAVVTPPADGLDTGSVAALHEDLDGLAADRVGEVARLRVVAVDDSAFLEDVAALLADDGAELVCVFGRAGWAAVRSLAGRYPATRFCAAPASATEPPSNADPATLAFDELGHLLGVATAALVGEEGTVAIVTGGPRTERDPLLAGLRAGLTGVEVLVEASVTSPEDAAQAATDVLAAAVDAVVVDLPDGLVAAFLDVVDDQVQLVAGPAFRARGAGSASGVAPVISWMPQWSAVVVAAIDRMIDPRRDVPAVLGIGDEAFDIQVAAGLPPEVGEQLAVASDYLEAGERDPTEPPPGRPAPPPADDGAGDDAGQ